MTRRKQKRYIRALIQTRSPEPETNNRKPQCRTWEAALSVLNRRDLGAGVLGLQGAGVEGFGLNYWPWAILLPMLLLLLLPLLLLLQQRLLPPPSPPPPPPPPPVL